MADRAQESTPFNEGAALMELERLRRGIEHCRSQRHAVGAAGDEYERFVSAFRQRYELAPTPPATAPKPSTAPARAVEPVPGATRGIVRSAAVLNASSPLLATSPVEVGARPRTPVWFGTTLVLLVLAGAAAWALWPRSSERSSAPGDPAAPAASPTAAAVPAATGAAPAPRQPGAELATTRRVWVRVTIDGERVLEQELPADTRVPLTAVKEIVVRTGDAGAVRLSIAGRDQGALGGDGQVVTRSFAVPAETVR
ncbi:MAG: DUF4115 domain-containing protein [Vicinamibacterales bacterium]